MPADGTAYLGGVNPDLTQRQLGNLHHLNAVLRTQLLEEVVTAGTVVAHSVIRTHHQRAHVQAVYQILLHELRVA